jgi:hypothetical protein
MPMFTPTYTVDAAPLPRLGSLVLQEDAVYTHHDAAGVKGLAVFTAHGDNQFYENRKSCTSSVLTAIHPQLVLLHSVVDLSASRSDLFLHRDAVI